MKIKYIPVIIIQIALQILEGDYFEYVTDQVSSCPYCILRADYTWD